MVEREGGPSTDVHSALPFTTFSQDFTITSPQETKSRLHSEPVIGDTTREGRLMFSDAMICVSTSEEYQSYLDDLRQWTLLQQHHGWTDENMHEWSRPFIREIVTREIILGQAKSPGSDDVVWTANLQRVKRDSFGRNIVPALIAADFTPFTIGQDIKDTIQGIFVKGKTPPQSMGTPTTGQYL